MINTGVCPYCKKRIVSVGVEDVDIKFDLYSARRGFSYKCPSCKSVLSIQINPYTLNDELKDDILKEVKKMLH